MSVLLALMILNARHVAGLPTPFSLAGSPLANAFPSASGYAEVIEDLKAQNPAQMQGIFDGKEGEGIITEQTIHNLARDLKEFLRTKLNAPQALFPVSVSGRGYGMLAAPGRLLTNLLDGLVYQPRQLR